MHRLTKLLFDLTYYLYKGFKCLKYTYFQYKHVYQRGARGLWKTTSGQV